MIMVLNFFRVLLVFLMLSFFDEVKIQKKRESCVELDEEVKGLDFFFLIFIYYQYCVINSKKIIFIYNNQVKCIGQIVGFIKELEI